MNKNILSLSQDLGVALELMEKSYLSYVQRVKIAVEIAEKLKMASEEMLSKPHIEIEDFEIDN